MKWDDVLKIIFAAIASVGGAGVIITGVSNFLAKSIFDRYMEKIRHKYDEDLEKLKHKYELELTKVQTKFDNVLFASNLQYEKEFSIYLEICEKMNKAQKRHFDLYKDLLSDSNLKTCAEDFYAKIEDFEYINRKYQPFIDSDIHLCLIRLSTDFYQAFSKFNNAIQIDKDKAKETLLENCSKINDEIDEINKKIKRHLSSIRIIK